MIDLHCQTRLSDGSASLQDVMEMAQKQGVRTLAITDHDTMAGCAEAQKLGETLGIRVIPGTEISAIDPKTGRKVHILCYAPQDVSVLEPILSSTLHSRRSGALEAMEVLVARYPVSREMMPAADTLPLISVKIAGRL